MDNDNDDIDPDDFVDNYYDEIHQVHPRLILLSNGMFPSFLSIYHKSLPLFSFLMIVSALK